MEYSKEAYLNQNHIWDMLVSVLASQPIDQRSSKLKDFKPTKARMQRISAFM
jgi:hypothetical protein